MDNPTPRASFADQIVDDLLPEDFEWREKARAYPLSTLAVAALGGFMVGRSSGRFLIDKLLRFGVDEVTQNLSSFIDARPAPR